MGIFGDSAQDQVDLDHLKERVTKLESALATLQAQVAGLALAGTAGASTPTSDSSGQDPTWLAEVRDLKRDGNVIQAIKVYREHTGLGLKEAKDAVDAMP